MNLPPYQSGQRIQESTIKVELLRYFVQRNKVIAPLGALGTVVIAASQLGVASLATLAAFVVVRFAAIAWTMSLCAQAKHMGYAKAIEAGIDRRAEWATGWVGTTWGAGVWLLPQGSEYGLHGLFLITGVVAIIALMLDTICTLRRGMVFFYLAFWALLVGRLGPRWSDPEGWILPAGAVVLASATLYFGYRMHAQLRRRIVTQLEKQDLFETVAAMHVQALSQKNQLEVLNAQLAQALDAANVLASRDALTGLLNRRAMLERGQAELSEQSRRGGSAMVVMVDLDYFKQINDTYGHQMGDRVLIHTAVVLRNTLREEDVLARWGGEEFLLLMPRCEVAQAFAATQRLCHILATTRPPDWPKEMRVTASFGMAELGWGLGLEATIALADDALYQAKEAGRNRGVVSGHPELV